MQSNKPEKGSRNLITKRAEFSASHCYWNPDWDEQKNREVFGKYTNEHGHNFTLEVTVEGVIDPETGMIINLSDLKSILNEILRKFDHMNLNLDHPAFSRKIPTPENIAAVLWGELEEEILRRSAPCKLHNVRLYETDDMYVDYRRETK